MKGISPQSTSKTYLIVQSLTLRNVSSQRASIQHSITAHTSFNTPTGMSGNFRQAYSRNYCSPSSIPPEPKGTPKLSDASTGIDNSKITTRNHAYYQRYSISGFYPIVSTPPSPTKELPKEDKQVKKIGHKQDDIQAKKAGHEYTCPFHSYSHAYYRQFSIDGFYRINDSSADSKPTKKPSIVKPKDEAKDKPEDEHRKLTCTSPKIDMVETLALAAAFIPSTSSHHHQKTNKNMEHLNLEHDIIISTQTNEELGFETLGITGFQSSRDDMEGEKDIMDENEKEGETIELREGGSGPVRAGLSAVWLLLSPI
ncbi:hypothetical protein BOTNAR_0099g00020 [Botryotinia narcissicola]|uniref:Uncharacterized protein n=1 Tax=Botryotinia narcissicola TaxID=278944 RepID=A0A4Z1IQ50_9HELO|nr:hypothetical protein BOTNAR_0099g00020 [Botryotinia narcissicola]